MIRVFVLVLLVGTSLAGCSGDCGGPNSMPKAEDYVCTAEQLKQVQLETTVCTGPDGSSYRYEKCYEHAKMSTCMPAHIASAGSPTVPMQTKSMKQQGAVINVRD